MINIKILVEKDGIQREQQIVIEDEHDFREEYDCQAIRTLVDEVIKN